MRIMPKTKPPIQKKSAGVWSGYLRPINRKRQVGGRAEEWKGGREEQKRGGEAIRTKPWLVM